MFVKLTQTLLFDVPGLLPGEPTRPLRATMFHQ